MKTETTTSTFDSCYLPLWDSLMTADTCSVEAHPEDERELIELRRLGIIRGKKWVKLTKRGMEIRNAKFCG